MALTTIEDLQRLITDEVEESLTLEFKAAAALARSDSKKAEITKDVSAMCNSAGGTIIYGVAEFSDAARRHLPERLDPVERSQYSKEWLEQVIGNIRPRPDAVTIHPVPIDGHPDQVIYVVEIPQSDTAHQAQDHRYYKRYNFESVPMADHEVRDVMGRSQHPKFAVTLTMQVSEDAGLSLSLDYHNVGSIYAMYVNGFVWVPEALMAGLQPSRGALTLSDGQPYYEVEFANLHRDLVDFRPGVPSFGGHSGVPPTPFYTTRYDPVLPGLGRSYSVSLGIRPVELAAHSSLRIRWALHADNAPCLEGETPVGSISVNTEQRDG